MLPTNKSTGSDITECSAPQPVTSLSTRGVALELEEESEADDRESFRKQIMSQSTHGSLKILTVE